MTDISSKQQLRQWLTEVCQLPVLELQDLPEVISQRHYYRAVTPQQTFIASVTEQEQTIALFVQVSQLLANVGWLTPTIYHSDVQRGYLLQQDVGCLHWYDCVQQGQADYQRVLDDLLRLQQYPVASDTTLPTFDWSCYQQRAQTAASEFLCRVHGAPLTTEQQSCLSDVIQQCSQALQQSPQVLCHRDFHSRNIMVSSDGDLVHIDFQLMCMGPLAYDLASILRDAYVALPDQQVMDVLKQYHSVLPEHLAGEWSHFLLCFDAATVLRYLRCLKLFAYWSDRPLYREAKQHALLYLYSVIERQPQWASLRNVLVREESV